MNTIIVRALAKINLAIDVKTRREDNYHEIDMVTIPLKLHDSIEIAPISSDMSKDTYLYCDDPSIICDESNLAYKALNLMKEHKRIEGAFQIMIHKRIPVEAGLGGGSADAAAVIRALDNYSKEDKNELIQIEDSLSLQVGSDVPFCIHNKPSRVQGIGEKLTPIEVKNHYYVLIVKPNMGLSTKSVYEAYDLYDQSTIKHPNIDELILGLKEGNEELIGKNMINVLSYPAIKALPQIQDLLNEMKHLSLPLCGMSGTGSACFAISKDKKHLEHCNHIFERKGYSCYFTEFAI